MTRSGLLIITVFLIAAGVCARLAVWQLDRLHERRASNAIALAARAAPVVLLSAGAKDSGVVNRRVRATGHYDHAHDIVLRGQVYRGVPGVEIVSPLVLEGNTQTAVLVNRGFVPAPDAVTLDPTTLQEPGKQTVEGIALPVDTANGIPLHRGPRTTWARLDRNALRAQLPYRVYPFYIRQAPGRTNTGFPRRLDPPALNDGPHLNYAIQWFAFAAMALVFGGIMARLKRGNHPAAR
ncbi:MAG TPA: SURF1 family protein [Gemmatimonadales bacterium]